MLTAAFGEITIRRMQVHTSTVTIDEFNSFDISIE